MDPIALSAITLGRVRDVPASSSTSREGRLGVNFACYVGHSNLRRWVMGAGRVRRAPRPTTRSTQMRAMRRRGHGRRRGRAVVVGRPDPPRPRRPPGAVAPGRAATSSLALAEEAGAAGAGSIAYLPVERDRRHRRRPTRTTSSGSAQVSGLPGRHPGPRRPQQDRRADRDLGGRRVVPRPRHRGRRAGVLDADRPAVRPADRHRRDELPLPLGAVVGPDAEAAARRAGRRCCGTPRPATSCATRSSTTTAIPRKGTTVPPPLWRTSTSTTSPTRATRSSQSRSISDLADELGVAPADALLDLALAEDLATRFRWRTESPEWAAAVGEAQLDPRMIIGTSDGGAHLARDDGADWSSYFLRSVGAATGEVWTLEEGIRQITADARRAARPRRPRRDRAPARPADLVVFDPETDRSVEEGVRARPSGRRRAVQGVGPGRAGDDRQRRADRARRRAHRAPPRPGGAPGRDRERASRAGIRRAASAVPQADAASRQERTVSELRTIPRRGCSTPTATSIEPPTRVGRRCCRPSSAAYAPRVLQYDDHFRFVCGDRIGFRIQARSEAMAAPGQTAAPSPTTPIAGARRHRARPPPRRHGRRPHRGRRAVPDVRADDPGRHRARAGARAVPRDQRLGRRVLRARSRAPDRRRARCR